MLHDGDDGYCCQWQIVNTSDMMIPSVFFREVLKKLKEKNEKTWRLN